MPRSNHDSKLIVQHNPGSPLSEAYRALNTNIQFSAIDSPIQTLMVTSAQSGDGKSTTIANLAITYAQEGRKTLLIDCDLRRPSLHHIFMLSNQTGLTIALKSNQSRQASIQKTSVTDLYVMTSGPIPPNPSAILTSRKMQEMIGELREEFDMILIDTPPILAVADGLIISSLCDGVIFVINHGTTKYAEAKKVQQSLEHAKARLLGVVLNNQKREGHVGYYYSYRAYGETKSM